MKFNILTILTLSTGIVMTKKSYSEMYDLQQFMLGENAEVSTLSLSDGAERIRQYIYGQIDFLKDLDKEVTQFCDNLKQEGWNDQKWEQYVKSIEETYGFVNVHPLPEEDFDTQINTADSIKKYEEKLNKKLNIVSFDLDEPKDNLYGEINWKIDDET